MPLTEAYNHYPLFFPNDIPAFTHSPFIQPGSSVAAQGIVTCPVHCQMSFSGQLSPTFPSDFPIVRQTTQREVCLLAIMDQMGASHLLRAIILALSLLFSWLCEDLLLFICSVASILCSG